MQILPDWAVSKSESFQFNKWCKHFANIITNKDTKTPISIAITGSWGEGKTSLLQGIYNRLDENNNEKKTKLVWFNAWQYYQKTDLLAALIMRIVQEMDRDGFLNNLRAKKIEVLHRNFGKMLSSVVSSVSEMVTGIEVDLSEFLEGSEMRRAIFFDDKFREHFFNLIQAWTLKPSIWKKERRKLEGCFRKLDWEGVHKIIEGKPKVVIFIDDLDRCHPDATINLLESINLFLLQPGCVFILAYDHEQISRIVKEKYPWMEKKEYIRYVEKLSSMHFPIPIRSSKDIKKFFVAQAKSLGLENLEDKDLLDHFVKMVPHNPRCIKRVLSLYKTTYDFINGTSQDKRFKLVLFELAIISTIAPRIIEKVKRERILMPLIRLHQYFYGTLVKEDFLEDYAFIHDIAKDNIELRKAVLGFPIELWDPTEESFQNAVKEGLDLDEITEEVTFVTDTQLERYFEKNSRVTYILTNTLKNDAPFVTGARMNLVESVKECQMRGTRYRYIVSKKLLDDLHRDEKQIEKELLKDRFELDEEPSESDDRIRVVAIGNYDDLCSETLQLSNLKFSDSQENKEIAIYTLSGEENKFEEAKDQCFVILEKKLSNYETDEINKIVSMKSDYFNEKIAKLFRNNK